MNRTELFTEVKSWLEAGKIAFTSDDETVFRFRVNAENGLFDLRLLCEEAPATIQVCCFVPVRIPKEKVVETGLLLHNLNARLRIGTFQFHVEDRVIAFRLTMPIRLDGELAEQFGETVGTTVTTMEEHVRTLGLLACATPDAQKAVARLSPKAQISNANSELHAKRFELN